MSAVLPIARDGRLRRNTLGKESALSRRINGAFDCPFSGISIRTFTSPKNYIYENFDAIKIQRRISESFPIKRV